MDAGSRWRESRRRARAGGERRANAPAGGSADGGRPLRIAQVAPLFESVPPRLYGGTERVVAYLTEHLVARGHDVTLFASGDSVTRARLVAPVARALRLDGATRDGIAPHLLELELVTQAAQAGLFDVVHAHVDYLSFPHQRRLATPVVTTLHGRLDLPELPPLYQQFGEVPVVSISDAQRRPLPAARWVGTVHHGLPRDLYRLHPHPGDYLAFVGRISPEKGLPDAVRIALACDMPLRIGAKVDPADWAYFEREVRPLLDHPLIEFVGEVDEASKEELLGGARALLFPIDWPEPFGLVVIEALACGTPVIARPRGSIPELLRHGATGFLFEELDEACRAVQALDAIDRTECRQEFERRFTVERMVADYLTIYRTLVSVRRSVVA